MLAFICLILNECQFLCYFLCNHDNDDDDDDDDDDDEMMKWLNNEDSKYPPCHIGSWSWIIVSMLLLLRIKKEIFCGMQN